MSAASPAARETTGLQSTALVQTGGPLSIFAFWLILPLVGGALFLLFTDEPRLADTLAFLGLALFISGVWTLVTLVVFRLTTRYNLEYSNRLARNLILIGTGGVVAVGVAAVGIAGRALFFGSRTLDGDGPVSTGEFVGRMVLPNLMIYLAVALTGLARDASNRARARREEAVQLQAHNAQLQAQLAEARLRVLHTQLNPHFLFNTLNAVSGLMDEDPRGARRMIARLSELLRYALQEATDAEIPVHEELKLVGRYLEIVEIRYEGRLETGIAVEPEARNALVPSLILQPLAENAMKHGVGKAGGHGKIQVEASRAGDRLLLRVLDTGPGSGPGAPPDGTAAAGGGLGLRHTRERLQELYGPDHRFSLTPRPEGGMVAEIDLPYHTSPMTGRGALRA